MREGEHEVERFGAWFTTLRRVEVRAFGAELWSWCLYHERDDGEPMRWAGALTRTEEEARAAAAGELASWRDFGGRA